MVRVGRASDNDVAIPNQRVSRYHAQLRWTRDGWVVYDLDSTNGTYVDDENVVTLDMTLTSAACPLTDVIEDQSRTALVGAGLVTDIKINWVWNPPWGPDKITDDGREMLRALGFNV